MSVSPEPPQRPARNNDRGSGRGPVQRPQRRPGYFGQSHQRARGEARPRQPPDAPVDSQAVAAQVDDRHYRQINGIPDRIGDSEPRQAPQPVARDVQPEAHQRAADLADEIEQSVATGEDGERYAPRQAAQRDAYDAHRNHRHYRKERLGIEQPDQQRPRDDEQRRQRQYQPQNQHRLVVDEDLDAPPAVGRHRQPREIFDADGREYQPRIAVEQVETGLIESDLVDRGRCAEPRREQIVDTVARSLRQRYVGPEDYESAAEAESLSPPERLVGAQPGHRHGCRHEHSRREYQNRRHNAVDPEEVEQRSRQGNPRRRPPHRRARHAAVFLEALHYARAYRRQRVHHDSGRQRYERPGVAVVAERMAAEHRSHCRYGDSADSPQHPSPPPRRARHQILHPLRGGGDIADGACGDAEHGHGDNEVDSRVVDAEQSHAGRADPEGHELSAHDAAEKHEPLNPSEQPHGLYYAGRHPLSLYRFHGRDMKNDSA